MSGINRFLLVVSLCALSGISAFAQETFTLAQCQEKAQKASPLAQQTLLHESVGLLKGENLKTQNLPSVALNAQFTYQSDVFALPFGEGSPFVAPNIPKDQYQITLNVQQKLFDGGVLREQQRLAQLETQANQKKVEMDLFPIKETVTALYFQALLLQENEQLLQKSVLTEIENQLAKINASIRAGVVLENAANSLKIEQLKMQQQLFSVQQDKAAVLRMLAKWTDDPALESGTLQLPTAPLPQADPAENLRPELHYFKAQQQLLEGQQALSKASALPKFHAFANGGIGRPNPYNFFEVTSQPFYIIGVKMTWEPFKYGSRQRDREQLGLQSQLIEKQRDYFTKSIQIGQVKDREEINKLQGLLSRDTEIVQLQEANLKIAAAQLQNGVLSATQYVSELTVLTQAQLNQQLHKIQLAQATAQYWLKVGQ